MSNYYWFWQKIKPWQSCFLEASLKINERTFSKSLYGGPKRSNAMQLCKSTQNITKVSVEVLRGRKRRKVMCVLIPLFL